MGYLTDLMAKKGDKSFGKCSAKYKMTVNSGNEHGAGARFLVTSGYDQ